MQPHKPFNESEIPDPVPGNWGETLRALNNFAMHFPFGNTPIHTDGNVGMYRSTHIKLGWWDKMYVDVLNPKQLQDHTELRCYQTTAEFYDILDRTATVDLGIPMEKISAAVNRVYKTKNQTPSEKEEALHSLYQVLLPIYIAMRKKGYNRLDIWK